jgi:hypothetical protein
MSNLLHPTSTLPTGIAPNSTQYHFAKFQQEVSNIRELLEDNDDCKWAWEPQIACTIRHSKLPITSGKGQLCQELPHELPVWIETLKKLDPMRMVMGQRCVSQFMHSTNFVLHAVWRIVVFVSNFGVKNWIELTTDEHSPGMRCLNIHDSPNKWWSGIVGTSTTRLPPTYVMRKWPISVG